MLLLVVAPPHQVELIRNALEPLHEVSDARFVDTTQGLVSLHERLWDAIILVHPEPASDSTLLLNTYINLAHGAPVIVLVDAIGEDAAAELVRHGVTDVVSYARIKRLPTVIEREIRARKDAEAERNRLQGQLLEAQKMEALGILAGGVAHDFNNILAAILCNAEVLLHDLRRCPNAGEMPEIVYELQSAAQRGTDLVRQILTFSRRANKPAVPEEPKTGETNTNGYQKAGVSFGRGEHVLIVDDETALARMFGRLLQGIGYQVTVQTESIKALEIFELDPSSFHVVLVDLHMPQPGGIEVAQRIRESRPDVPIFIMSGFSDSIENALTKDLGTVGILQKPITRETLAKELRRVLDSPATK